MTKTISLNILSSCLITMSLFLVLLCVLQIGFLTREHHIIANHKNKIFHLAEHNQFLTLNFLEINHSPTEEYISVQNFARPTNTQYIKILDTSVVTKNQ